MCGKKIPIRKCIGCWESFSKKELIRIVRTPSGKIALDLTSKANGRGAYVCSLECFNRAIKKNKLGSALNTNIDEEMIKALSDELSQTIENKV